MLSRRLLALVVPDALILLAAALAVVAGLPAAVPPLGSVYPLAVLAAGLLLGWRLGRPRLVIALIALALADRALAALPLDPGVTAATSPVVQGMAVLLALDFAVLAFLDERGPLTTAGQLRIGALAAESGVIVMIAALYPADTARVFRWPPFAPRVVAWSGLSPLALCVVALALLVVLALIVWRPEPVARGFLWATVAACLGLRAGPGSPLATFWLSTSGLILCVAAIERTHALAYRDELTGVPSRRALNDALRDLEGRYTVAMIDVDHFKQFNDRHGHDVGDQVLRMVAARLARAPGGGRVFRYGGEEFTLLFAGRSVTESMPHLEAARREIESAAFTLRGADRPRKRPTSARAARPARHRLSVTVSIGAAESGARHATPDEVVQAADRALYRAKEAGRNRVAV